MRVHTIILEFHREVDGLRISSSSHPHADTHERITIRDQLYGLGMLINDVHNVIEQIQPTGKSKEEAFQEFLPLLFTGMNVDIMASVGEPAMCFTELQP